MANAVFSIVELAIVRQEVVGVAWGIGAVVKGNGIPRYGGQANATNGIHRRL